MLKNCYLGSTLNGKGTDGSDCNKRVKKLRKIARAIRSLVNERNLSINCARVLNEKVLVPTLLYGSECMEWKCSERSRIQAVQMDNLRSLLGIRRTDKVTNERIRELVGVKKGVNELINENVLR